MKRKDDRQVSMFERAKMFKPRPRTDREVDVDAAVLRALEPFAEEMTLHAIVSSVRGDNLPKHLRDGRQAVDTTDIVRSLVRLVERQAVRYGPRTEDGRITWVGLEPWAPVGFGARGDGDRDGPP